MLPSQDNTISTTSSTTSSVGTGVGLSFNFSTGEFNIQDGKIVELTHLEALQMWITKVCRTTKNQFKVYTNGTDSYVYGITLAEYANSDLPFNYIKAEIQTEITNALLVNSDITAVYNFNFDRSGSTLSISFTVDSKYGTIKEVEIDV